MFGDVTTTKINRCTTLFPLLLRELLVKPKVFFVALVRRTETMVAVSTVEQERRVHTVETIRCKAAVMHPRAVMDRVTVRSGHPKYAQ